MFDVLNSYLFQNKSISIPGLGTIYIEAIPATADISNSKLLPPVNRFRFDKYVDTPEKEFFSYLAVQKKIPDYEAIKWYNEFSFELTNRIRVEEKIDWEGVGTLKKDIAGNIIFESTAQQPYSIQPVPAKIVSQKGISHTIMVGDREKTNFDTDDELAEVEVGFAGKRYWWVYALIVIAVAIGTLLYYLSSNNWKIGIFGNQQKVQPAR